MELDLGRLWSLSVPEEEFTNLFVLFCSTMLKNGANTKSKTVKECIFTIFTVVVQKYKHSLSVATSLISLLCNNEQATKSVPELMELFVDKNSNPQFVGDIIRFLFFFFVFYFILIFFFNFLQRDR